MTDPVQYLYSKDHTWAVQDADGSWLVGISDYAQEMLGDVVFVEPPKAGDVVTQGQACGLVESVKTGSDLYAPLSGTVLAINDAVLASPELLNDQPYTAWIFRLQADAQGAAQLLSASDYQSLIA